MDDKEGLEIFLHALLAVEAHGVERTIVLQRQCMFGISEVVLGLLYPLLNARSCSDGPLIEHLPLAESRPNDGP